MLFLTFLIIFIFTKAYYSRMNNPKLEKIIEKCPSNERYLKNVKKNSYFHKILICNHWVESICCSDDTLTKIKNEDTLSLYKLSRDHCKPLSQECKNYFQKYMCLSECGGIFGSFLKFKKTNSITESTYHNIPICENDCNNWFQACYNDMTCSKNWLKKGFIKNKEGNFVCKNSNDCKPFNKMFKNSNEFCKNIYNSKHFYKK